MSEFNEYSSLSSVAVRDPVASFISDEKLNDEWKQLRFHSKPQLDEAKEEFEFFKRLLIDGGTDVINLDAHHNLTIDSIYTRDSILISPDGLILCNMGRSSRTPEAKINYSSLKDLGCDIAGDIKAPGTLEGGDFIWIDKNHAAVGLGPRTNQDGIKQLKKILGNDVDLHVVPLPEPNHPDDVLHLMSIISPLDKDLALIYEPLIPQTFIDWLHKRSIELITVNEKEYHLMGCNVLATAPREIIMLEKLPNVQSLLEEAGCKIRTYKGDEISRKGEGGPTCLTRPITRVL
jgi:N-dimethylarginine dimethylaminohydrolase